MKINVCNAMLLAFGIAGAICFSAPSGEAGESPSVAIKAERLTIIANFSSDHYTVPARPVDVSVLCRLPIQIADWTIIDRPARCN